MNILINGARREVPEGITIALLLGELGITARHVAVEVNMMLVPKARHAEVVLSEGDRLEVVTLVGGG